jgi:hypothetical protein
MDFVTTNSSWFELVAAAEPSWSDEQVVRSICERLLDEGEVTPPVDVELLASLCGIVEVQQRPTGPSGMLLVHTGKGWVASVLEHEAWERQRFTILHEGGHTLLPGFARGGQFHRCAGARTREEELCDLGAAELLLPRRFFVADAAATNFGLQAVENLAGTYGASIQATAVRAVDLAEGPAALLVLSFGLKPVQQGRGDARLRLEWAHTQGAWPFALKHKSVHPGSVLLRAWRNEPVDVIATLDELFASPIGPLEISARRYGDKVLAIARRGAT